MTILEICQANANYVAIRYATFPVQHDKWPAMEVGETCCDHLTDTTAASDHVDSLRRYEARQRRFIQSKRWKSEDNGILRIRQKGFDFAVEPVDQGFRLIVNNIHGKRRCGSSVDAKKLAFEVLENGQLERYLRKVSGGRKGGLRQT